MMKILREAEKEQTNKDSIGDGKAVYMDEMSDSEYAEYEKMELNGWNKFYNKLKKKSNASN